MFKRKDTLLFFAAATGINILTVLQTDGTFFLYGIGQLFVGLLLCIVFVYSIVKTLKDRRQISFFKKLEPLIFELLLMATVPLVAFLTNTDRGKNVVIKAGISGDLTFVHLDLWDDGTFKLTNSGPFGGQNYRGNYTLRHDTLHLDKGDTNLYPTLTFVIRKDTVRQKRYFDPVSKDTTKGAVYKLYIQENSAKGS